MTDMHININYAGMIALQEAIQKEGAKIIRLKPRQTGGRVEQGLWEQLRTRVQPSYDHTQPFTLEFFQKDIADYLNGKPAIKKKRTRRKMNKPYGKTIRYTEWTGDSK